MIGAPRPVGRWRALLAGALCACALAGVAPAADTPNEVHGHSDAFAANGVRIAWGVRRGTTEESTLVVLRVAADPARYTKIAVDGVDPFTQQKKSLIAEQAPGATLDIRVPRAHFADFPRTELRLSGAGGSPGPSLLVFYLGVPDTTPEFADDARLGIYLTERIARLDPNGSKSP